MFRLYRTVIPLLFLFGLNQGCEDAEAARQRVHRHRGYSQSSVIMDASVAADAAAPDAFVNSLSLNLDGVNEHATCGDPATTDGLTAATWSWWMRIGSCGSEEVIWSKWNTNQLSWRFACRETSKIIAYIATSLSANAFINSSSGLHVADTWEHYVVVYNGALSAADRTKLYRNGSLVTPGTTSGTMPATMSSGSTSIVRFGATEISGGENYFGAGNIDETALWIGTALSDAEVTSLYNAGVPTSLFSFSPGPTHWWRMGDNDTFSTISDNVGTLHCSMVNAEAGDFQALVP